MKINEVAKLTGITIRTLHYYDEIGLLKPTKVTNVGYRLYDGVALERLQEILFFKELDFSLNEIKEIINNPKFDKKVALATHKELLIKKRQRLDGLIDLVESRIKGKETMSFKEFDQTEIEASKKKYAAEVKERWGKTEVYKESEEKTKDYDNNQWNSINNEGSAILKEMSGLRGSDPESVEVQDLVKKWQDYISANFYKCNMEILSGLGQMYSDDSRFKENIDKNGIGTAEFLTKAIEIYCEKNIE